MSDIAQQDINALVGLYAEGRLSDAETRARELIGEAPDMPVVPNILGAILAAQGRLDDAIGAYRRAIEIDPGYAQAHNNLGIALKESGAIDDAIASFRRAAEIDAEFAEAHSNLAGLLQETGKLEDAVESYRHAVALDERYFEDHNNLGIALQQLGQIDEAIASYGRAIEAKPDFAEAFYNLGKAHEEGRRPLEAIASYEHAVAIRPDYVEAHNHLGNALKAADRIDEALDSYRKAIEIDSAHVSAYENLGHALMEIGRLEEGAASYRDALAVSPDSGEIYRHLANATKFTGPDDTIAAMEELYGQSKLPPPEKMHLGFALGKAYGDLEDHERSFEFLLEANRLKRATYGYASDDAGEWFGQLAEIYSPAFFKGKKLPQGDGPVPIFIVGMPRSGTTLVEQILASHPQAHGAGELNNLDGVLGHVLAERKLEFPAGISDLDDEALYAIAGGYIERLASLGGDAGFVTDKLPHNFLHLGLIARAMPSARLVHVRRDAMDNCFSIFANYFTGEHAYAYDLSELGAYYRIYQGLMTHWREVLPEAMFDLDYETLVEDPEPQIRALLDYCGLPFDAACLAFHKTERAVRTASAAQVRRPLYRDSVQRWRNYEKQLAPLKAALDG